MEFFKTAKAVKLRSHLDKYLVADDNQESVRQSRNAASRKARWTVELVDHKSHVVRLKSCHGLYLAAADHPFLLGMTGKKVLQAEADKSMDFKFDRQYGRQYNNAKAVFNSVHSTNGDWDKNKEKVPQELRKPDPRLQGRKSGHTEESISYLVSSN